MEEFYIHLAKSSLFLLVAYGIYLSLIRLTTFHNLNRSFLLLTVAISIIFPFFHFPVEESHIVYAYTLPTIDIGSAPVIVAAEPSFQLIDGLWFFYVLVSVAVAIRLMYYLFSLVKMLHKHPKQIQGRFKLIYSSTADSAFSFFRFIVLPTKLHTKDEQIILQHEKIHAKKWHSIDVLLLELVKIFFWFHPVIYLLKHELIQQHEFEIDRLLITQSTSKNIITQNNQDTQKFDIIQYGNLLIQQAQQIPVQLSLTNNFNHSLIKNRIQMMTKQKSKNIQLLRYVLLVPLLGLICTLMSFEKEQMQPALAEVLKLDLIENREELTKFAANNTILKLTKPTKKQAIPVQAKATLKPNVHKTKNINSTIKSQTKVDSFSNKVFTIVEIMPKFSGGGDTALLNYFGSNINYPEAARLADIQGVVVLGFTVEKDGRITDLEILRDIGGGCGEEAMRIAKKMPTWSPGMQDGKTVRVAFKLPVRFKLDGINVHRNHDKSTPVVQPQTNQNPPIAVAEKMPEFPDGEEALLQFFGSNIIYPEVARKEKLEGMIILEFIIEKDGSLSDLKIVRDIGGGCGNEALRIAKQMPKWSPGMVNNKPVRTNYKLPVRFKLVGDEVQPEE